MWQTGRENFSSVKSFEGSPGCLGDVTFNSVISTSQSGDPLVNNRPIFCKDWRSSNTLITEIITIICIILWELPSGPTLSSGLRHAPSTILMSLLANAQTKGELRPMRAEFASFKAGADRGSRWPNRQLGKQYQLLPVRLPLRMRRRLPGQRDRRILHRSIL
jgi:hypothetical protein